jgi:hypothetical protein
MARRNRPLRIEYVLYIQMSRRLAGAAPGILVIFAGCLTIALAWINGDSTAHDVLKWIALIALVLGSLGLLGRLIRRRR